MTFRDYALKKRYADENFSTIYVKMTYSSMGQRLK